MNNLHAIFIFTLEYDSLHVIIHIKYSENKEGSRVINTCLFLVLFTLFVSTYIVFSMESFKNYKIYARFRWLYERSFHFYMEEDDFRLGRSRFWRTSVYNFHRKLSDTCICCLLESKSVMN